MGETAGRAYLEGYSSGFLCLSLGHMAVSWALGALIFGGIHASLGAAYLALCIASVVAGLRFRCRFCWYYGRTCYSGLGKVAALIFKPGRPQDFVLPSN